MNESSKKSAILCWNVWTILNVKKLQNFLQILHDKNIELACVCETWFDSKKGLFSKTIKDSGYELFHAYRGNQRGGGVAIFYKRHLGIKEGEESSSLYISFEFTYVTFAIPSNRRVVLVCVYRKQEIAFSAFHDEYSGFMDKIMNKGDCVVVVGDFNIWTNDPENKEAQKFSTLMNSYGLN